MASEKYYEVMRTDFVEEGSKSLGNIFDKYNETIDIVNQGDLTLFDLDKQLSIIRWAEKTMSENLEDFKLLIEAKRRRREEKAQKSAV
jgi:hypothetical protein